MHILTVTSQMSVSSPGSVDFSSSNTEDNDIIHKLHVLYSNIARYIENTRWVSIDIKFTRQGFEKACWHCEACRGIQHAFSKPSLVNLISKDANLVFYLSVYLLFLSSNKQLWRNFWVLFWFIIINDVIQKVQHHHDLKKHMLWDRQHLSGNVRQCS